MGAYEAVLYILTCTGILFISQLSPGPDFILVIRTALNKGWRAGAWLGMGIGAGGLIHISLFCLWGTWLLEQSWSSYLVVAAGAWLLYLAYNIFKAACETRKQRAVLGFEAAAETQIPMGTRRALFMQGFVCNLLNVKFVLFIASIGLWGMEQYASSYVWYAGVFILALTFVNSVGWIVWSLLFQWKPLRAYYKKYEPTIDTIFALLLALLALSMVIGSLIEGAF